MKKAFSLIELSIVILIISILIAGGTQSSRLVRAMKLSSAKTMTQSSDVTSIKDLSLWLEATSDKSFFIDQPEDGTAIAQWNNINPQTTPASLTHAIQLTITNQPIYNSNGINGLPSMKFTSTGSITTSSYMSVADGFDGDSEDITLFVAWKPTSGTAEMDLLEKWGLASSYPYALRSYGTTNSYTYGFGFYDGVNNPLIYSTTIRNNNTPQIISARRTKQGPIYIYVNGNQESAGTDNTTPGATTNNDSLYIGVRGNLSNFVNGEIGEIIIFSRAIRNEERKSVEKYLGKKWGIKIS